MDILPIAFFDVETTGTDVVKDRIVQISIFRFDTMILVDKLTETINPGVPIPKEASDIHGITDEDVKDKPTFKEIMPIIGEMLRGANLCGFNSNKFDIPILVEEVYRNGGKMDFSNRLCFDAATIFMRNNERTLVAAAKEYLDMDLEDAHDAEADARATADVFFRQLQVHENLPKDPKELELYCNYDIKKVDIAGKLAYNDDGEVIYTIGKAKGKRVSEDPGFGMWMLGKDFPYETKERLRELLYKKG